MRNKLRGGTILLTAALLIVPLQAHHSIPAHYFMEKSVHLEGEVTEFAYQNPHSLLHLQVKNPGNGELTNWIVEWGPVRRLQNQGVSKDALKPGDHVIVEGHPSRDNLDRQIFMQSVERPSDGWKAGRGYSPRSRTSGKK